MFQRNSRCYVLGRKAFIRRSVHEFRQDLHICTYIMTILEISKRTTQRIEFGRSKRLTKKRTRRVEIKNFDRKGENGTEYACGLTEYGWMNLEWSERHPLPLHRLPWTDYIITQSSIPNHKR